MQLALRDNLLFIAVSIAYRGAEIEIPSVLVDTGSASTLFATDVLAKIGIVPEPHDILVKIYGVGGAESVFARRMDRLQVGGQAVEGFEINIGAMDYGLEINGILGMDFLMAAGAVINLRNLQMDFQPANTT
jgi:predicted aspartyl protease